jgi:uncharacterized protein (DUF433 family)
MGPRYTLESILELSSSGMAVEEILADYEDLDREDLLGIRLRHASQSDQAHKAHSLITFSPDS